MASSPFKLLLRRETLAKFLPDFETIKEFEKLFSSLTTIANWTAKDIETDTGAFDGNLTEDDTTVQAALNTIDRPKFYHDTVQNVTGADTVTSGVVFCTGSGYALTMPDTAEGRKVEVFNKSTSGFITVSQVCGEDFDLYNGESLDMTWDGTEWRA